jgi:hypothetical protein
MTTQLPKFPNKIPNSFSKLKLPKASKKQARNFNFTSSRASNIKATLPRKKKAEKKTILQPQCHQNKKLTFIKSLVQTHFTEFPTSNFKLDSTSASPLHSCTRSNGPDSGTIPTTPSNFTFPSTVFGTTPSFRSAKPPATTFNALS